MTGKVLTANIFERVVRITTSRGQGSGVVVEFGANTYVITARHLFLGQEGEGEEIEVWHRSHCQQLKYTPTLPLSAGVDIEILRVANDFARPDLPVRLSSDGNIYSGDVFFLGFPYGLGIGDEIGIQLPFVKSGIMGGSTRIENKWICWLLDGINNPGFSGGPVVHYHHASGTPSIMGIVHGYHHEHIQTYLSGKPIAELTVPLNTGIILAWDIAYAKALMEKAEANTD